MPIVIKEIHVRTVVERRIASETELTEEVLCKIENRVMERMAARENGRPDSRRMTKRKNER